MSNRYNVLPCDLDDPNSIQAVGETVKERALQGACSYFELQTRLEAARIVIECNPAFGTQVQILEDEQVIGKVMSPNGTWHRYLKVDRAAFGLKRGEIAHKILALINAVESQIPEENVRGYDMILFYLQEGYVPCPKDRNEGLESKLVAYLKRKRVGKGEITASERDVLPYVRLQLSSDEAADYLAHIKAQT